PTTGGRAQPASAATSSAVIAHAAAGLRPSARAPLTRSFFHDPRSGAIHRRAPRKSGSDPDFGGPGAKSGSDPEIWGLRDVARDRGYSSRVATIELFVYGTLRPGGRHHERFCRGLVRSEPGLARGTLEHLPAGYPRLHPLAEDVLSRAGDDLAADATVQ